MTRGVYLYDHESQSILPKDEALALRASRKTARSEVFSGKAVERGRWIYDRATGELVPAHQYRRDTKSGLTIQKDIEPYQAVFGQKVDGKLVRQIVGGRAQHRDELRARNVVEVGNEKIEKQYEAAPGVAEDIRRAMYETGYRKDH